MPGTVNVKIVAGRDLPVMDRASETADAFVEIKFSQETFKTEIYPKSLNPQWNSDWFSFEAEDHELQDEHLHIRVMDYDMYSANDAVGRVYVDLDPLLSQKGPTQIAGWLPIYDTMHGIRGEIYVIVKVDLFTNVSEFRYSSCGVDFFGTASIPPCYASMTIHGFVEELLANTDPEYHWIDKIRTPRTSNETRQALFSKMSGELTRKIGIKVLKMGANAVLGYVTSFDLEGASGIVARAVGTAVRLVKAPCAAGAGCMSDLGHGAGAMLHRAASVSPTSSDLWQYPVPEDAVVSSLDLATLPEPFDDSVSDVDVDVANKSGFGKSLLKISESSDADDGSATPIATPKTSIVPGLLPKLVVDLPNHKDGVALVVNSSGSETATPTADETEEPPELSSFRQTNGTAEADDLARERSPGFPVSFSVVPTDQLEPPLITIGSLSPGAIASVGGIVCARSVKLLDKNSVDDAESRDAWWLELRREILTHMRSLNCSVVLGYREQNTIGDDVCVLTAYGTAAVLNIPVADGATTDALLIENVTVPISATTAGANKGAPDAANTDAGGKSGPDAAASLQRLHIDTGSAQTLTHNDPFLTNGGRVERAVKTNLTNHHGSSPCSVCHVPYGERGLPFAVKLAKCSVCGVGKVANILLTTLDIPPDFPLAAGTGPELVQARLVRRKSFSENEALAREISDVLPFVEHELHSQLASRLKLSDKNCVFGLRMDLAIGENMIAALATGTAVNAAGMGGGAGLGEMKKAVMSSEPPPADEQNGNAGLPNGLHTPEAAGELTGNPVDRETTVLETEDFTDVDVVSLALPAFQPGFICTNVYPPVSSLLRYLPHPVSFGMGSAGAGSPASVPSADGTATHLDGVASHPLQMFCRVIRERVNPDNFKSHDLSRILNRMLKTTMFKYRKHKPVLISNISFGISIPEENEIEVTLVGMIHVNANTEAARDEGVKVRQKSRSSRLSGSSRHSTDEDSCSLDAVASPRSCLPVEAVGHRSSTSSTHRSRLIRKLSVSSSSGGGGATQDDRDQLPTHPVFFTPRRAPGEVTVTPLPDLGPDWLISGYLGHFNFFFIRETTTLKEVGGLGVFLHTVMAEILYIVQSHVISLGGDAMVSFRYSASDLLQNLNRNHAQCLVYVSGDMATAAPNYSNDAPMARQGGGATSLDGAVVS